jgi:hypothetical protein
MIISSIHLFIILSFSLILPFSNNLLFIFICTLVIGLIYLQSIIYDGCILTKYEKGTLYIDSLSNLVKMISCTNIRTNEIDKIIIVIGLIGYIAKLSILGYIQVVYNQTWSEYIATHKYDVLI